MLIGWGSFLIFMARKNAAGESGERPKRNADLSEIEIFFKDQNLVSVSFFLEFQ